MFLLQHVQSGIMASPIKGNLVARAFAAIAMLALAQILAGPSSAQDQERKKILGQRLVDEIAAKHKPDLIYLGLHSQTPKSKKSVIDDLDGALILARKEEALAFDIHGHMVKVSLDVGQFNGLHRLHGLFGPSMSGHSCDNTESTKDDQAAFHLSLRNCFLHSLNCVFFKRSR